MGCGVVRKGFWRRAEQALSFQLRRAERQRKGGSQVRMGLREWARR